MTDRIAEKVDEYLDRGAMFAACRRRRVGTDNLDATLYPIAPGRIYVNFGFWDVVEGREPRAPGRVNRAIEREVARLSGVKSLYSESYYDEDEFWRLFDRDAYRALKARYDPGGRLPGLYEKCVLRRSRTR